MEPHSSLALQKYMGKLQTHTHGFLFGVRTIIITGCQLTPDTDTYLISQVVPVELKTVL